MCSCVPCLFVAENNRRIVQKCRHRGTSVIHCGNSNWCFWANKVVSENKSIAERFPSLLASISSIYRNYWWIKSVIVVKYIYIYRGCRSDTLILPMWWLNNCIVVSQILTHRTRFSRRSRFHRVTDCVHIYICLCCVVGERWTDLPWIVYVCYVAENVSCRFVGFVHWNPVQKKNVVVECLYMVHHSEWQLIYGASCPEIICLFTLWYRPSNFISMLYSY